VAGHLRDIQLGLHHHHTGEDELLWPLLLARVDLDADRVLRMERQHEAISSTLDDIDRLLPAWESTATAADRDALAAALTRHHEVLVLHLDEEEQGILGLIEEHLTVPEWDALHEHFERVAPKNKLLFFLGALLEEATPAERALLFGQLPLPARLLWRLVGKRQYANRVRAVRG
jgi:hypothetical protein